MAFLELTQWRNLRMKEYQKNVNSNERKAELIKRQREAERFTDNLLRSLAVNEDVMKERFTI
jgi:hypothetical protein